MGSSRLLLKLHQHCIDEAQKTETVTLKDVLFAFLQPVKMPSYQYPCSLVAQFTEDIYKNAGTSDVLPLVMKSLDAEKVLGVQFFYSWESMTNLK